MKVYLNEKHDAVRYNPALRWRIMKSILFFLRKEGYLNAELGIILSGDRHLASLNYRYRDIKGATDVLSFSFAEPGELEKVRETGEDFMLGEIYISVDRAVTQAKEDLQPFEKRVVYLLAHGLYHLIGYDHSTAAEQERMDAMVDHVVAASFRS